MKITFEVPDNTLMINIEYTYRRESSSLGTSTSHVFTEEEKRGTGKITRRRGKDYDKNIYNM